MDAFTTVLEGPVGQVEPDVRRALASAGFGILTEIDVAATLREKLGVDRPPLRIIGACNPSFADRALRLDPSVALVLPCNVVLEDVGGRTRVSVADPRALVGDSGSAELTRLGQEAAGALEQAIASLGT